MVFFHFERYEAVFRNRMGLIRPPLPVKLFVGMLASDPELFAECTDILCREYGPLDSASEMFTWDNTDYYAEEMGKGILRQFLFFNKLCDPESLRLIKQFTASIEDCYTSVTGGRKQRRINIDPGYVTEAKVVLASTKDFAHRVYLGSGIYAEVTLRYCSLNQQFTELDHTFPDFRSPAYRALFLRARCLLRDEMQRMRTKG